MRHQGVKPSCIYSSWQAGDDQDVSVFTIQVTTEEKTLLITQFL